MSKTSKNLSIDYIIQLSVKFKLLKLQNIYVMSQELTCSYQYNQVVEKIRYFNSIHQSQIYGENSQNKIKALIEDWKHIKEKKKEDSIIYKE